MRYKEEFVVPVGEMLDVTQFVQECVEKSGVQTGICSIYEPHCNCGLAILGNNDKNILKDVMTDFARLAPPRVDYICAEDPVEEAAHTKCFITGCSKDLPIEGGRAVLGSDRSVFLARFAGEGPCVCVVTVLAMRKDA